MNGIFSNSYVIYINTTNYRYFVTSELRKAKEQIKKYNVNYEIETRLAQLKEYKSALMRNTEELSKIDGYAHWRVKEISDLSSLVQKRFRYWIYTIIQ